jgi:putative aminopeptidase FrvX
MADDIIEIAKRKKFFQLDADYGHTQTDADPISMVREGFNRVFVATRYLHSSVETLFNDIGQTIELWKSCKTKLNFRKKLKMSINLKLQQNLFKIR